MQESEFRDWARRAQGAFDERLKALEKKVGGLELGAASPRVGGEMAAAPLEIATELLKAVKGGGIRGIGVVYLGPTRPVDGVGV